MKKIFTLWVANKLINRGFKVVSSEINLSYPNLKVFIFEDTVELRQALGEITNK